MEYEKEEIKLIVYNNNHKDSQPIMIITAFKEDPAGGPAIYIKNYSIAPGDGIDLAILGLGLEKINGTKL